MSTKRALLRPALQVLTPRLDGTDLLLPYCTNGGKAFTYTFRFSCDIAAALAPYPKDRIERLLDYIALGVAIYLFNHAYFETVHIDRSLSETERLFFEDFYFHGMAEFRLINIIPLHTRTWVTCGQAVPFIDTTLPSLRGAVIANGGGKDGAVGSEAVRSAIGDITWFTWNLLGSRKDILAASPIRESLIVQSIADVAPYKAARYSGHKPLNGPLAFLVALAALIEGKKYAIVSNEHSANEANMVREGLEINHQYTKSFAVEKRLALLISGLGLGVSYFSVLRPLYELQIMRILQDFPICHRAFVSCNQGVKENVWCLHCAKCAFLVLCVTALKPTMTQNIWGDTAIIAQPALREHLVALVSKDQHKPFECVGTLDECRLSLGMIHRNNTFWNSLPADFREDLMPHVPNNMKTLRRAIFGTINRENNIPAELLPAINRFFSGHLED